MKKLLLASLFISTFAVGQQKNFIYGIGLGFQTAPLEFFSTLANQKLHLAARNLSWPYSSERNIQGLGIPLFMAVKFNNGKNAFEYSPTLRYDEISFKRSQEGIRSTDKRTFIFNQAFYLNTNLGRNEKTALKIGLSFMNPFQKIIILDSQNPNLNYRESIGFNTIDLGISRRLGQKMNFTALAHYIPSEELPGVNSGGSFVSISTKLSYIIQ